MSESPFLTLVNEVKCGRPQDMPDSVVLVSAASLPREPMVAGWILTEI